MEKYSYQDLHAALVILPYSQCLIYYESNEAVSLRALNSGDGPRSNFFLTSEFFNKAKFFKCLFLK